MPAHCTTTRPRDEALSYQSIETISVKVLTGPLTIHPGLELYLRNVDDENEVDKHFRYLLVDLCEYFIHMVFPLIGCQRWEVIKTPGKSQNLECICKCMQMAYSRQRSLAPMKRFRSFQSFCMSTFGFWDEHCGQYWHSTAMRTGLINVIPYQVGPWGRWTRV